MNPVVGDEVLYHEFGDRWVVAEVLSIQETGEITLTSQGGMATANHGAHIHGWLTYHEASDVLHRNSA